MEQGITEMTSATIRLLTLLAPELVEAILDGLQPVELQLDDLLCGSRSGRRAAGGIPES